VEKAAISGQREKNKPKSFQGYDVSITKKQAGSTVIPPAFVSAIWKTTESLFNL
jgi:hypothetical protein